MISPLLANVYLHYVIDLFAEQWRTMRNMSRFDLDVLYARAKAKLWSKVERLRRLANQRLRLEFPPPTG